MHSTRFILIGLAIVWTTGASADSLPIKPGLWKSTSTVTMPFGGGPQTDTSEYCVEQDSYDPAEMMDDAQDCVMDESEVSGDTLRFKMSCDMQGSQATMTGRFQTDGDSGNGDMKMEVSAGGMNMEMDMKWTAERIGDC